MDLSSVLGLRRGDPRVAGAAGQRAAHGGRDPRYFGRICQPQRLPLERIDQN
jgi:hypothetical protein